MVTMSEIKCKKCRKILFKDHILVTNHNQSYGSQPDSCSLQSNVFYLNQELLTDWLISQLDLFEWTKGKIYCPNLECKARIGSFNFINGSKCLCHSYVLPHVHVIKAKVDKPLALPSTNWSLFEMTSNGRYNSKSGIRCTPLQKFHLFVWLINDSSVKHTEHLIRFWFLTRFLGKHSPKTFCGQILAKKTIFRAICDSNSFLLTIKMT